MRVRDPVHGFIQLSQEELRLVECSAFSRLRNIKQLALTCLVYPGAMHTRFEHSLGVMELASRAFDAIDRKCHQNLNLNFKKLGMTSEQARTLLRVTALLHDIGHLPFSHGGEGILPMKADGRPAKHEDVSIAIIRDEEVAGILRASFYADLVDHVCLLLDEAAHVPPELLILKGLISGQFDADKMDYLSRDSLHCGVEYGNFDYLRLLETLRVKPGSEGGLELSIESGGIHSLEAMVLARYWMFTQVYCHKTRRIYDMYLSEYLKLWYTDQYQDLLRVLKQDDLSVMTDIIRDAQGGAEDVKRQQIARRILRRHHHRVVYGTSDHADARDVTRALKVKKALEDEYPNVEFMIDLEASGNIHKFYVRGDEDSGEEFPIFDPVSTNYRGLSDESPIFAKLPKRFKVVRIYAGIEKESLPQYREFAASKAKEVG